MDAASAFDPSAPNARLSIALYQPSSPLCSIDAKPNSPHPTYHWSLILSSGVPTAFSAVEEHQIVSDESSASVPLTPRNCSQTRLSSTTPSLPIWKLAPKCGHCLCPNPKLLGCVVLGRPVKKLTCKGLGDFVREYIARQASFGLLGTQLWSCGTWVVRVMEDLIEAGIMNLDLCEFEGRILKHARELEQASSGASKPKCVWSLDGLRVVPY